MTWTPAQGVNITHPLAHPRVAAATGRKTWKGVSVCETGASSLTGNPVSLGIFTG